MELRTPGVRRKQGDHLLVLAAVPARYHLTLTSSRKAAGRLGGRGMEHWGGNPRPLAGDSTAIVAIIYGTITVSSAACQAPHVAFSLNPHNDTAV